MAAKLHRNRAPVAVSVEFHRAIESKSSQNPGRLSTGVDAMDSLPKLATNEERVRQWDAMVDDIEQRHTQPAATETAETPHPPFPDNFTADVTLRHLCDRFAADTGARVNSDVVRRWASAMTGNVSRRGVRRSFAVDIAAALWQMMCDHYLRPRNAADVQLRGRPYRILAVVARELGVARRTADGMLRQLLEEEFLEADEDAVKISDADELAEIHRQNPSVGTNQKSVWLVSEEATKWLRELSAEPSAEASSDTEDMAQEHDD